MSGIAAALAAPGVHRISVPLPFPPHEVAAWLLEGDDGYTLVEDPLSDYLASLRRLRALPVDVVLPSHGDPFEDLGGRVDQILAHHESRNGEILRLLAGAPRTSYEVAVGVFGSLPPESFLHALRETRAHLIHLRTEGRVRGLPAGPERWEAA